MAESDIASRPAPPPIDRPIAIVASLYNEELVNGLVDAARTELAAIAPGVETPLFRVPGAFEIPSTIEHLCSRADFAAVIALGVIIRGKTAHADLIGKEVTRALMDLAICHDIPVIHEVLLVDNEEQARERCLGAKINRGIEAARAAARMSALFHEIEMAYPEFELEATP